MNDDRNSTDAPVPVRVLYFEGCPNYPPTVQRIRTVAERLGAAVDLREVEVTPNADPNSLGFRGSPTVQVNGVDIDPSQRGQNNCGFGCRTYDGSGVPEDGLIAQALQEARKHEAGQPRHADEPT